MASKDSQENTIHSSPRDFLHGRGLEITNKNNLISNKDSPSLLKLDTSPQWPKNQDAIISPSNYAPELAFNIDSNSAPEVSSGHTLNDKMEYQEEKIVQQEDKIVDQEEKITITWRERASLEDKQKTTDSYSPRKSANPLLVAWERHPLRVAAAAVIILLLLGILIWIGVKKSTKAADSTLVSKNNDALPSTLGMAALQWSDLAGIKHHRVYFEDTSNAILESAWDSNASKWQTTVVASSELKVQNRSTVAAAAGWPHANHSYTLVRLVPDPVDWKC
jgi:hypothetical protein